MSAVEQQSAMAESETMGRIIVDVIVANYQDRAMFQARAISGDQVRQMSLRGVVDTGANHLVLPSAVADQLGLKKEGEAKVRYADQSSAVRDIVGGVELELLGRRSIYRALLEPDRETALIGAIVLEDLDFVVDPGKQRIYPRDPERIIAEVE